MEKKTFTYGGYTFEPRGQFKDFGIKKNKDELYNITRALHYDNRGYVADGDEPYNYEEFYKAAGRQVDDVFYCQETGELYVPCAAVLCIFDRQSTGQQVTVRYKKRREAVEQAEHSRKQEALRSVMTFTEEQNRASIALRHAIDECRKQGMSFAVDGTDVYLFRSDLLDDLDNNMVPMNGQERIEWGLVPVIEDAWDACEGLYANPKPVV